MEGDQLLKRHVNELKQDAEFSSKHSPLMDVAATARFLNTSTDTIYKLSSKGIFDNCKCRVGRRRLFLRNCVLDQLVDGKLDGAKRLPKAQRPSRSEIATSLLRYMKQLRKDPHFASQYGELLTMELTACMLNVGLKSLYEWSSRGLINTCKRKLGRKISIFRDCLLNLIATHGLDTSIRSKAEAAEYDPSLPVEVEYVG
ncbi:MAG: hypothetical protein U0796_02270 [Gemmatales bacterium]